jgi:pseudouridylate synthase
MSTTNAVFRAGPSALALETTLLVHGLPSGHSGELDHELRAICREEGAEPALVGVVGGVATVGMSEEELARLLERGHEVPKANAANLGVLMHREMDAATTVSATVELASEAGVRVFATGGLGGVHKGYHERLDISPDVTACARFPIAVVCSGVKSLLDVGSTREAFETLGVPVVGYRTDHFPAFYLRTSGHGVDARFDDIDDLAYFVAHETDRTGRAVVVCNPVPEEDELDAEAYRGWLAQAEGEAEKRGVRGRDLTPFLLAKVHELSGGATLEANLALVRSNVRLGAALAGAVHAHRR